MLNQNAHDLDLIWAFCLSSVLDVQGRGCHRPGFATSEVEHIKRHTPRSWLHRCAQNSLPMRSGIWARKLSRATGSVARCFRPPASMGHDPLPPFDEILDAVKAFILKYGDERP